MSQKLYIVIDASSEGNSFTITPDLDEATLSYQERSTQKLNSVLDDGSVSLAEVKPGDQFGFNYQGEFYGGEIITSFEKLNEE
jgi:hypothetical protein